ncbi:hypothetical protein PAMA_008596 [Pampus argenteus]
MQRCAHEWQGSGMCVGQWPGVSVPKPLSQRLTMNLHKWDFCRDTLFSTPEDSKGQNTGTAVVPVGMDTYPYEEWKERYGSLLVQPAEGRGVAGQVPGRVQGAMPWRWPSQAGSIEERKGIQ